jgi:hypothetical protein
VGAAVCFIVVTPLGMTRNAGMQSAHLFQNCFDESSALHAKRRMVRYA